MWEKYVFLGEFRPEFEKAIFIFEISILEFVIMQSLTLGENWTFLGCSRNKL